MVTLKQLEALYWIGRLGSFEAAARQLETSQSTITRRIQELEAVTGASLFDRTTRIPTLSRQGQDACAQAAGILERTEDFLARLTSPGMIARRVSIGVTELSSFSWVPGFLRTARDHFPKLELDLRVGSAPQLRQLMSQNELDIAVVPSALFPQEFAVNKVATLATSFCAARGAFDAEGPLTGADLARMPLIVQENTFFDQVVSRAFVGAETNRVTVTEGLLPLIAFVASGYGISVLPDFILDTAPFDAVLSRIDTGATPEPLDYVVVYPRGTRSPVVLNLIDMVRDACVFEQFFAVES
ncbi:LysR family transcriptional regulator [Tropicimonas sp. IMCC34011]|uniref:LysR family transcriptional regulator n=1 Tax=Tropicimonas sp. IMCC34011 TaxID=2248759 RepID=UPI000E26D0AF|nr:LysR family transcriptional regulator [Tropicimonas sp. IMCC34011]